MTVRMWLRLASVLAIAALVQVAILDGIVVAGAHPDLMLTVAIAAGLALGAQRGAVVGFVAGLVADLFLPTPFGLSALSFVLVAFFVGLASALSGGRASIAAQLTTALLAGIGGTLLFAVLATLIGQPSLPRHDLVQVVAMVSAGCIVLIVPAHRAIEWSALALSGARRDPSAFVAGTAR